MFAPQILHKLLFSNALGDTAYSQGHLKTMVYAKFGGANKVYYGEFENTMVPRESKNNSYAKFGGQTKKWLIAREGESSHKMWQIPAS